MNVRVSRFLFLSIISIIVDCALVPSASADPMLFDYGLNLSGTIYNFGDPLPTNVDTSGFDFNTGLGTILVNYAAGMPGPQFVDVYFNNDLSFAFPEELGAVSGTPALGQTWEISPEGNGEFSGDGFVPDAFSSDTFDDTNFSTSNPPFDVYLGTGFDFSLDSTQTAAVAFTVSTTQPTGFSLEQFDPAGDQIFLSGSAVISSPGSPATGTPEPISILLSLAAMGVVFSLRTKIRNQ
jgi:hypothetical protein